MTQKRADSGPCGLMYPPAYCGVVSPLGSDHRRSIPMTYAPRQWVLSAVAACVAVGTVALAMPAQAAPADSAVAHSKDGKRLFGSAEALRVARVSAPRLSP